MRDARLWTEEDIEILEDNWGVVAIPAIAKKINRSIAAVRLKASRIGLGRHLDGGEYISLRQLLDALGLIENYTDLRSRLKRDGLPVRKKLVVEKRYDAVLLDDFWEWAKNNKHKITFARFEENALGAEEDWVKKKRRLDYENSLVIKTSPWSQKDDDNLKFLLKQNKYDYSYIAGNLGRTEGAVKRRIYDLNLKDWPVRRPNRAWTKEDVDTLKSMRSDGYSFERIGEALGRTASSCNGKYERILNPHWTTRDFKEKRGVYSR